jgi:hypothetical protein
MVALRLTINYFNLLCFKTNTIYLILINILINLHNRPNNVEISGRFIFGPIGFENSKFSHVLQ